MSYRGNGGYTVDGDYLYISFEGMRETKNQISHSIEEAKGQKDNISRAIESLQVPDSILRGYAADLVPIKNSISKEIDQLEKINLHIDYVVRRFEEVDNEFAARFSRGSFEVQEKSGLTRKSAVFGGYNQYGPFMKSNNFLYDSQRMLDYLNGESLDKSWMLVASSKGWGPITYEEFCRRMTPQGVGNSALFGKWGSRDGSLDIQGTDDGDSQSVTAGDVAGKVIRSTIEGTAEAIVGSAIAKIPIISRSFTSIPALGIACKVETITAKTGTKLLKGVTKIAGPVAVASYVFDIHQDFIKYDGTDTVKAVAVTTVGTGLAVGAGLIATGVGAPVGVAIVVGVGVSVVVGLASDWVKDIWIGKK